MGKTESDRTSGSRPASGADAVPTTASSRTGLHQHREPELGSLGLFTLLLGAALPLIDFFIVNVGLATIAKQLHAAPALLELVVAGYGLAYAVMLVLGGRLGDTFGRRRLFIVGVAAFGATSLLCGLAPNPWILVIARVAQGAAASMMVPQVLGTIHAATADHRRARAVSMYGATQGLSMVGGQLIGGLLLSANLWGFGWRSLFLVNVPVVVVALLLSLRSVPKTRSARPEPVDIPGTVLISATLTALLLPLTEGTTLGWPAWTWVLLAASPLLALAFVLVEARADRLGRTPLVPPSLLRIISLRRGLTVLPAMCIGFSGLMFVLAITLQQGLRMTAISAGLALVPFALAFFAASLAGPHLITRFGAGRVVTYGGLLQLVGGIVLILTFWIYWPNVNAWGLVPGFLLTGFSLGAQFPVLFGIMLSGIPRARAGVGSGVMSTTQQAALALGTATLGSLFESLIGPWGIQGALLVTLLVLIGLIVLTSALSLRLPRRMQ